MRIVRLNTPLIKLAETERGLHSKEMKESKTTNKSNNRVSFRIFFPELFAFGGGFALLGIFLSVDVSNSDALGNLGVELLGFYCTVETFGSLCHVGRLGLRVETAALGPL